MKSKGRSRLPCSFPLLCANIEETDDNESLRGRWGGMVRRLLPYTSIKI